jgi:hypothetical protein
VTWPVRTRLCAECRAALSDGEECIGFGHTPLAPGVPAERDRLLDQVWPGPESVPPGRRGPRGAREAPLWAARPRHTGLVRGGAAVLPSPVGGEPCLAYGLWLIDRHANISPVFLRDGAALPFDVELDGGGIARVPAGSVDLSGWGRRLEPWSAERVQEYLACIEPSGLGADRPVVPFCEVREAVVRPDDRIAFLADLERVPDRPEDLAGPDPGPYRQASPPVVWRAVGRVLLRPNPQVITWTSL